jgi:hypothetical protein
MEVLSAGAYKVVVVTIDPAARASLAAYYSTSTLDAQLKMSSYLKSMVSTLISCSYLTAITSASENLK